MLTNIEILFITLSVLLTYVSVYFSIMYCLRRHDIVVGHVLIENENEQYNRVTI